MKLTPEQHMAIDLELPDQVWKLTDVLDLEEDELKYLTLLLRVVWFSGYIFGGNEAKETPWALAERITST